MIYNPYDLNPLKGEIGEQIWLHELEKRFPNCYHQPGIQKFGVDFSYIPEWPHKTPPAESELRNVDVKFSDLAGDWFPVTYRNSANIRHPYLSGCQVDRIAIVNSDWSKYIQKCPYYGESLKSLQKKLRDRIPKDEDGDKYYDDIVNHRRKGQPDYLAVLLFTHDTKDQLKDSKFMEQFKNDYVWLIEEIHVQILRDYASGCHAWTDGSGYSLPQFGCIAKKVGSDTYAAIHYLRSAIPTSSRTVLFSRPHEDVDPVLLTAWPYMKGKSVAISEKGKTLLQMARPSLEWIRQENKGSKSTFYSKVYNLASHAELEVVLANLLDIDSK